MDKVSLFEGVFFKKNIAILKIKFLENQFNLLGIYKVMQKTKKRLNAPLTYLDKPYPFVRVLLKKFFILALFKQRSGFFKN
jgi:hypothetical protein|nr:MAG TPA: hypothetical protein [Caudoviricetes sp.]